MTTVQRSKPWFTGTKWITASESDCFLPYDLVAQFEALTYVHMKSTAVQKQAAPASAPLPQYGGGFAQQGGYPMQPQFAQTQPQYGQAQPQFGQPPFQQFQPMAPAPYQSQPPHQQAPAPRGQPAQQRAPQPPAIDYQAVGGLHCYMPYSNAAQAISERDQSLMEYQQTVDMLQAKVRKLEQLVELKDRKLDGGLIPRAAISSSLTP